MHHVRSIHVASCLPDLILIAEQSRENEGFFVFSSRLSHGVKGLHPRPALDLLKRRPAGQPVRCVGGN